MRSQALGADQPRPSEESEQYSSKQRLDLRLMHHYSVYTAQAFTSATRSEHASAAILIDIPRLALEHIFLMDTVLLVSMIHLGCTDPQSLDGLPVIQYRDQALRSFRQAVANTTEQNISAVRTASQLLAAVSFASDRVTKHSGFWIVNWLALAVGQRNFPLSYSRPPVSPRNEGIQHKSSLYGSFIDIPVHPVVLTDIQHILPSDKNDDHWPDRHVLWEAAEDIGTLIAILRLPHEQSWLETKIKAWAFDKMPHDVLRLIRNGNPCALIILAYYLVLLKFLPDVWLYEDVASHDIQIIQEMLGPEWRQHLTIPMKALDMCDKTSIVELLTSRLPVAEQAALNS
ncbi:hypothetical protein N0V82_005568 [Gnomoniopsis sp. IMI 355080]|nr:hypothetical protein N0V82_005568 [Gnomoniopsis sp. IMI 355080]